MISKRTRIVTLDQLSDETSVAAGLAVADVTVVSCQVLISAEGEE